MDQVDHDSWYLLREDINRVLATLDQANIEDAAKELLISSNHKGHGLFSRSLLKMVKNEKRTIQTNLHTPPLISIRLKAQLVARMNSKNPIVGMSVLLKLCIAFKGAFVKDNSQAVFNLCLFLSFLVLYGVADGALALQILQVLLERNATIDSLCIALEILRNIGEMLIVSNRKLLLSIFEIIQSLAQETNLLDVSPKLFTEVLNLEREILSTKRKSGPEHSFGLGHICHSVDLSDLEKTREGLMSSLKDEAPHFNLSNSLDNQCELVERPSERSSPQQILDYSESDLMRKQKIVYLTIMSSMSAEESVHKLMKVIRQEKLGQDVIVDMVIKCCAQEKTYSKFFGLIGENFCRRSRIWHDVIVSQFQQKYESIYQYEGAQIRNIGRFFGHLLALDSLSIGCTLGCIHLSEEGTSSPGRVFIKFVFQGIVEELGISEACRMLQNPGIEGELRGIFPKEEEDINRTIFCINYFTAIGLGQLTELMRESLNCRSERGRKRHKSSMSDHSTFRSRSRSRSFSRSRSRSRSR